MIGVSFDVLWVWTASLRKYTIDYRVHYRRYTRRRKTT